MRYIIDHDFHIHTKLSLCSSDPNQNKLTILEYAKKNGLKRVCITDHFWDSSILGASTFYKPHNFERISMVKPLPESNVEFMFGCETDIDKNLRLGIPLNRFDDFDFVIIPITHMHMVGFTIDILEDNPESKAKAFVKRLDALLNMDLPFHKIGLAHLTTPLICKRSRSEYLKTLDLIPDNELLRLFNKVAMLGCGIELNACDMSFTDEEKDIVLRIYRIAKVCGCKFYLGSDAHHPESFNNVKEVFERAITLLGLTEEDKFWF